MKTVILSFCCMCGGLLREQEYNGGHCENCDHNCNDRKDRIEGEFTEEEATKLQSLNQ